MNIFRNIKYIVSSENIVKNQCIQQIREFKLLPRIQCEKTCALKSRDTPRELLLLLRHRNSIKNQRTHHHIISIAMPRAKATPRSITKAAALHNGTVKTLDGVLEGDELVTSTTNGNSEMEATNAPSLVVTAKVTKGRGRAKKVTETAVEVKSPEAVAETVMPGRGRKRAIVATIANGDVAGADSETAAKVVMQIKVSKQKGRGKKDATQGDVEVTIAEKPKAKGRGKTPAVVDDVPIQNLEQEKNVAEEIPAVNVKTEIVAKSAARGRKKKEQPAASTDIVANVEIDQTPNVGFKEENAVPPKKRATTKKIKAEPLTESQVDLQTLHEPVVAAEEAQISTPLTSPKKLKKEKAPKAEKPKKEKATIKKSKSKKETEDISEEIASEVKPTARSRKRALPADNAATEVPDINIPVAGNTVAVNSGEIKEELLEDLKEEKIAKKKRGSGGKAAKVVSKPDPPVEQDEELTEAKAEKKPAAQRGRKRAATANVAALNEDDAVDGAKPSKSKKTAPTNGTETTYNKADFELKLADNSNSTATNGLDKRYNLKISSWNVAGLRSWCKKDGLNFLNYEEPDIFCMQEIKCTTDQLPEEAARIPGYHPYWLCMPGGYAGVAIYSKIMPINVEYGLGNKEFDEVGRIITAEYEKFFLVCVYVPNSGRKLVNLEPRMRWEKLFQAFVKKLDARKPVVICGDMNVSHKEIDLANPKTNTRNAGFTQEERDKMSELLALGYVDTFRHLYPTLTGAYTFWTYMGNARARNVGWRLDYFIVSQRFTKRIVESCIRAQCKGSDHCPITLFLKL